MEKGGQVVTFYSFKGGVGRTFALANIAALLARWGKKVLCVDLDLEAPGLQYYFENRGPDLMVPGILDIILEAGETEEANWKRKVQRVVLPESHGKIDFIGAGRFDEEYVQRLHELDWDDLYANKGLGDCFERLRGEWKGEYDFTLIDSRTGITDIGGVCTIQLPDILVFFVSTNKQSLEGAIDVVNRAITGRNKLPYDKGRMITVPVISRFDGREEFERGREWLERCEGRLGVFVKEWVHKDVAFREMFNYLRLPYVSYWSFGERLPVVEDTRNDSESINYSLETLAAIIARGCEGTDALAQSRDSYVAKVSHETVRKAPVDKKAECEEIVKKTKEYMSEEKNRIKLDDLVVEEIRKVIDLTSQEHFPLSMSTITVDEIVKRLSSYEEILKPVRAIITVLCHWGSDKHRPLIQKIITRIAEVSIAQSGLTVLLQLRWYPIHLLLYTGGIAAIAAEKYENLAALFMADGPDPEYRRKVKAVILPMCDQMAGLDDQFKKLPGLEKKYTPRSEHMFEILQADLEDIVFLGNSYESLFDRYELFQMFVYADLEDYDWGPIGRFGWKHARGTSTLVADYIEVAKKQGDKWPPIQAGLFRSDINRFDKISGLLVQRLNKIPWF